MKPIEEFETEEQLQECLKWWQEKLFLMDWIIKAKMVSPDEFTEPNLAGENLFEIANKASTIKIISKKYYDDKVIKYCAEQILVHELLHCKYNWLADNGSYEGKYLDVMEHSLLEQMAKSLVMAKYNLTLDYFVG
jgi:hypothetical protein